MRTSLIDHLTALCASAAMTAVVLQSVALLGHPRPAHDTELARATSVATPAR